MNSLVIIATELRMIRKLIENHIVKLRLAPSIEPVKEHEHPPFLLQGENKECWVESYSIEGDVLTVEINLNEYSKSQLNFHSATDAIVFHHKELAYRVNALRDTIPIGIHKMNKASATVKFKIEEKYEVEH